MKKRTIFIVLAALCLYFSGSAQDKTLTKGLRPGDRLPPSAKLNTYAGQILILDFWATWCAPCRTMIPKTDSLNKAFTGKASIIPVTYEAKAIAEPVLRQVRKAALGNAHEIFSDTLLRQLFPHRYLPHYVWIDGQGTVRAITEMSEINTASIEKAVGSGIFPKRQKSDLSIAYDPAKPLFAEGNGGGASELQYRSVFSGYVPGLKAGLRISPFDKESGQRFTVTNVPFWWLLNLAYGEKGRWFGQSRMINLSRDSSRMISPLSGQDYLNWLAAGSGYCYELQLPASLAKQAYPILQNDIARLFPQYRISVENRPVRCLALVRTVNADSLLVSKSDAYRFQLGPFACTLRKASLATLVSRLERQFMQNSRYPLIDLTGFNGRVDLDLKAKMSDVADVNRALSAYGLKLEERMATTEMLVIADKPNYQP